MDEQRRCPDGHEVGAHHHFCPACGVALTPACPNGHAVRGDDAFCGTCGVTLATASGSAAPTTTPTPTPTPTTTPTPTPAVDPVEGWYRDPSGRFPDRWWNGSAWTKWTRDQPGGTRFEDAPSAHPAPVAGSASPPSPHLASASPRTTAGGSSAASTTTGSAAGSAATSATAPAAWYPDPLGRHAFRYWDGSSWTNHASTAGAVIDDPLGTGSGAAAPQGSN